MGVLAFQCQPRVKPVELHLKLTRDLHLKLTRLRGQIMAVLIVFFQSVYPPAVLKLSV